MKAFLIIIALVATALPSFARDESLMVNTTNGVIATKTNFFEANRSALNAALDRKSGEVVGTLANLLALDVDEIGTGTLVGVAGRSAAGDWGEPRMARWVVGSSEATNKAFVFAGTGGRWIFEDRKRSEIDATWFGVVASTTVDRQTAVGTDSSAALQDAYDFAFANRIGKIKLPAGVVDIGSQVIAKPGVTLSGAGSAFSQGYETTASGLAGATCLRFTSGAAFSMLKFRGSDTAAMSGQQTVFTSGDLSYNTNYNHGGIIEGVSFDCGYFGLRGAFIEIDSCFGVKIRDVSFYPYGPMWPIFVWASNVIDIRDVKGLTSYPIALFYSADCIVTECSIGGGYGPKLWVKGSKNIITDSQFFNTQTQATPIRQSFTANASTDTITIGDGTGGRNWWDGMPVTVEAAAGATLPGGITTNTVFYLIRTTGSDVAFKLNSRRTYNSSGTGGAIQGVAMDISSAGSGTFTIGPGPTANLLIDQYDQNQLSGVRLDQSAGDGIAFWDASENTVVGSSFTEAGWSAASDAFGAVRMSGASINNRFVGNLIRNRSSTSHAGYGLIADSGSTNNYWFGQLTGVTNMFGANPNTWFATRWDPTNQRMEVYNSGWRGIGTMPNGVAGVSYDLPGILKMTAPSNTVSAAKFLSTESQETIQLFSHTDVDGRGATISTYSRGGTESSPTQVLGQRELFEIVSSAHNGTGDTFSIFSLGARTAGPVGSSSAPTRFFVSTTPTNSTSRLVRQQTYENGATDFGNNGLSFLADAPRGTALRVVSTNGVFQPPVMTSTQRDAITTNDIPYGIIGNSTSGQLEWWDGDSWASIGSGGGGGGGSVTSVALSLPAIFTVSGSPVTTSGTLAGSLATQSTNVAFLGPVSGSSAAPTFRVIQGADLYAVTNLNLVSLTATDLNAGTLNIITNSAGEMIATNGISLAGSRITSWSIFQTADADLDDLADGSLTGSKVGIGINAANITTGTLSSTNGGTGTNSITAKSLLVGNGSGPVKALVATNSLSYYGADGTPMVLGLGSNLSTDGTNLIAAGGGGGSGDVVGPASATDNALVRFDSTTGKLIQNSSATLDDSGLLTVSNLTVNGSGAGSISISDATGTNRWTIASPASVTSTPRLTLPAASGNGVLVVTNNGTNMVAQFIPHPGVNGVFLMATNSPAQGYAFGAPPASGGSTNSSILDTAYGSVWNGDSTNGPSRNAVYDILHVGDTDDDGKADVLDLSAAGYVRTTSGGVISVGTTSENLASDITDETGTDKLVFNNAPTLTNAVLTGTTSLENLNLGTLNLTNTLANAALDADLAALGNNSTSGLLTRTGAGTASARTITGTAWGVVVSNGDGVSGNPTIDADRTASPGSNPTLPAGWATWGSVGIVFEGNSSNSVEGTLNWPLISTADKSIDLPDASGTIVLQDTADTLSNKSITNAVLLGSTKSEQGTLSAFSSTTNYVGNYFTQDYLLITATNNVNFLHATNAAAGRSATILVLASGADRTVTLPSTLWMSNVKSVIVTNGTVVPINLYAYGSDNTNTIATVGSYYSR